MIIYIVLMRKQEGFEAKCILTEILLQLTEGMKNILTATSTWPKINLRYLFSVILNKNQHINF